MDPQTADLPIFKGALKIGVGSVGGIEGDAIIFDNDLEPLVFVDAGDTDQVFVLIIEPVVDDIREQLIQSQIDLEGLALGKPAGLAELSEMLAKSIQLRHAVFQFK